MKKKWIIGTGIGMGAVMLLTSGLSASADGTGYETYKEALKHSQAITSIAGEATVRVTDNGASLFTASTSFKGDQATHAGSAVVQLTDGKDNKTMNIYHQEGQTVIKHSDSDVYKVINNDANDESMAEQGSFHGSQQHAELVEKVFDTLVGQLRHQVTLTEGQNGTQQVSLHLNSSQIAAPVQAISSLLITAAANREDTQLTAGPAEGLDVKLPKLVEDVRITAVNLDAVIDSENFLSNQAAEIKIAGKDEAGKTHELNLNLTVDFTDRGQAAPEKIDLTGKQVEVVTPEAFEHGGPTK